LNPQVLLFLVLAAITAVSAVRVVTTELITHAALFLALAFVAVAGIFLQLQADFLAAAQVLIYAGAITTMIIFAIMLSDIHEIKPSDQEDPFPVRFRRRWASRQWGFFPVLLALLFAGGMFWLYRGTGFALSTEAVSGSTTVQLGLQLFNEYALPFELASILLLVAMIGAIILTAKEVR